MYAARKDDLLLHPPLAAELFAMATEAVIYAAATAAVGAAIGFAVGATIGTCGAAGPLIPIVATALVGAASMIPVEEGKSIGDAVSGFSEDLAGALFPAEPYGAITSGSQNTWINGKMAARAAGKSLGPATAEPAPEPAEEPSILETIGSYAMIGASMALPIIGLAQQINDIFNPPVTTPADPKTETEPLDTVKCSKHPPMPEQFVAQGSDKVFINGQPAAREGDKSTCDGKIGLEVSPNVRIGGGTVTVRDITDGKSALAKITGLIVGLLITRKMKFGCGVGNPVLPSSGSKYQAGPEDVDFSLPARVPFDWARSYDSDDLRENGLFGKGWSVPFETEILRVDHPQGGELWVHVDEQGTRMELGRVEIGTAFVSVLDGRAFFHQDGGITVVENIHTGLYHVYKTDPLDARRSRLVKVGDRNLNNLELFYDEQGRLQYLGDLSGRSFVELLYDSLHPRRVSQIQRLYLHDGADFSIERRELLAAYAYTPTGQLAAVSDASGQQVRQFSYTSHGYMASHTLASGATREYEWAWFVTPEQGPQPRYLDGTPYTLPPQLETQPEGQWRVVRHWGSDGEDYQFTYDLEQGHTHVIDSLGREEHYYWGPLSEVYKYVDAAGNCWQNEIIAGQTLRSIDPLGREWHYSYDNLGRMISSRDPLGRSETAVWSEHWTLPLAITDGAGRTRRFAYDRNGNLLREQDPLGQQTTLHYDSNGDLLRVTNPQGRDRHLCWNRAGQLTQERDCSGSLTEYRYDMRGMLAQVIDPLGQRTLYQHDARGYLQERQAPDGKVTRYQVDTAGQLTARYEPGERVSQWRYDASGRIVQRVDAMGFSLRYVYDAYGRLLQLHNENDEAYRFEWDALDRLQTRRYLDGSAVTLNYNAAGETVTVHHHPAAHSEAPLPGNPEEAPAHPQRIDFTHDAAGRRLSKRTADGLTEYAYDAADNLLTISFTDLQDQRQQLDFAYDALDRLTAESSSAGPLHYSYDELGYLRTLTLPDQRKINHLYYGSGHLHQLNLDGRVICDFERNNLHDEVLRTQGRLLTRRRHDADRRLIQQAVFEQDSAIDSLPLLQKDYRFDSAGRLSEELVTRARAGSPQVFSGGAGPLWQLDGDQTSRLRDYGPTARIHGLTQRSGRAARPDVQTCAYDKAGNLLDGYPVNVQVQQNRVHVHGDCQYRYDRFGRLREKRSGRRLSQRFEYDAQHRLVSIDQQRGAQRERLVFTYDPLGRRIGKTLLRENQTQPVSQSVFIWQGLRLLGEQTNGLVSHYVYADPLGFEPLARIDGGPGAERLLYFHNDASATPEQLSDEQGRMLWQCNYRIWGAVEAEWHDSQLSLPQNLRLQGQYLDRESGLHYNMFRFYDPDIGRFTQPDPIGLQGGINLYRYAPNPIEWFDPFGLDCRRRFVGYTPSKWGPIGRKVIDRMRTEGRIMGSGYKNIHFLDADGNWYHIKEAHMSHRLEDAVDYWNRRGGFFGPRNKEVRSWMRDPKNYELEYGPHNSLRGSQTPSRYNTGEFIGPRERPDYPDP